MDVQFRKHMVIPYDFETRVFESGEKALWQSEKNFTDQVFLDLLSQYAY